MLFVELSSLGSARDSDFKGNEVLQQRFGLGFDYDRVARQDHSCRPNCDG